MKKRKIFNTVCYVLLALSFIVFSLKADASTDIINGIRYSAEIGSKCGKAVHITTCAGQGAKALCKYDMIDNVAQSGTVYRGQLTIDQNEALKACNIDYYSESATKYRVTFTPSGNDNVRCGGKFSNKADAYCYNVFDTNSEQYIDFSNDLGSINDTLDSYGRPLYGWTTVLNYDNPDNPVPYCTENTIISKNDPSVRITGNMDFYGCYTRIVATKGGIATRYSIANCDSDLTPVTLGVTECFLQLVNGEEEEYCYYQSSDPSGFSTINSSYLKVDWDDAVKACNKKNTSENGGTYYVKLGAPASMSLACGAKLKITTCEGDNCRFTKVDGKSIAGEGTINKNYITTDKKEAEATCKTYSDGNVGSDNPSIDEEQQELQSCDNEVHKNVKDDYSFKVCYDRKLSSDEVEDMIYEKLVTCKRGYAIDTTKTTSSKPACNSENCTRTYTVTCTKFNRVKPTLDVTSGIVGANGIGTIRIKAQATEAEVTAYYVSEQYIVPTSRSEWKTLHSNEFTIDSTPGVKYIWVMDSNGTISNAYRGTVIDTVNMNNTVKQLQLYDNRGKLTSPSRVAYDYNGITSSNYVRLSNNLANDSNALADAFNPFDNEYELEVSGPTVTVYATLTSSDAKYVEGYEPRTVNLQYGMNTVLIKIQDKEGKVRTYTILVNRTDDRTSDNTLNSLAVGIGDLKFNANVTNYNVTIPVDTKEVAVSAKLNSDVASFVSGYEPGVVQITGDTTTKLVKVKSQTGSTRTYVINFIKKGTDIIEDETLQLFDLNIPNVYIPFEESITNYSLSVDYETDRIDLLASTKIDSSKFFVKVKDKNSDKYEIVSNKGITLDVGENYIEIEVRNAKDEKAYYRFTIIRKEFGLDVSSDKTLKELNVLGYNIGFTPEKKDYKVKIKTEKSLVITAVPANNRAEVFILGNDNLTGFSTVRVKVVAENGEYETYSIDIGKDAFNKEIEFLAIIAGAVIILLSSCIIIIKKKVKSRRDYYRE